MQYKRGEQCEDECPQDHYADEATNECVQCHYECRGCHGPGPSNCDTCRNFKIYEVCNVMSCLKYVVGHMVTGSVFVENVFTY